ncbi:hypothetical protein SESBI_19936 [Sesbania bispinosa]|nr:hypothetical protein SESBI_19936 [Sesbania bispinosa]
MFDKANTVGKAFDATIVVKELEKIHEAMRYSTLAGEKRVCIAAINEEIKANIQITREIESNIVKCEEIESELATNEAELIKTSVMLQFDTVGYVTVAGHDYTHEGVDDIEPSSSL